MKVSQYTQPFMDIKSVILFYHGKYPHIMTPDKDVTFPQRIFPNAKFYIRCNARDPETRIYFHKLFKGFEFEIVDERDNVLNLDVEAVFTKQELFVYFGGVMERFCVDYNIMLNSFKGKIFILYNDEFLRPFDTLDNEYKDRAKSWFIRNDKALKSIPKRTFDYSNTYIIANDNRITDWVEQENLIGEYPKQNNINLIYLTDKVLYDLPDKVEPVIKDRKKKLRGIYISLFFSKRISTWNKIMKDESLDLKILGSGTDKLRYYKPEVETRVPNSEIAGLYREYDWSLYMGKGTPSLYLGATFFVPLLNNCPLFIWRGTDPEQKIFPDIECYYDTAEDLGILIKRYESGELDINNLLKQQLKHLF